MSMIKTLVISIFLLTSTIQLHADNSPSTRYLTTHPLHLIKPYMKKLGVTEEHVYVFNDAIANETEGFFGYHGTSREYRIYQDIIRFGIQDILEIPIRNDFHFLRIPGDSALNFESAEDYIVKMQTKSLPEDINDSRFYIPLNISLYENFYFEELCSIAGITRTHQHNVFEKKLIPFFERLGIDSKHISKAFEIARSKLPNKGILLQFFDSPNYAIADRFTYCSLSNGKPYLREKKVSEFILNQEQTAFPHLRLVINNSHITNPQSSLVIKRYDMTSDYIRRAYEDALRNYLKSLQVNHEAADQYKAELLSIWENS